MELAMPSKEKVKPEEQNQVKASRAITIVLGKDNKIFYWTGMHDEKTNVDPVVTTTDFAPDGIRKFLLEKNLAVVNKVESVKEQKEKTNMPDSTFNRQKLELMKDKTAPIVIIKATNDATYKNLVDIFDEMAICSIGTYALVDITPGDLDLLKKVNQQETKVN